MISDINLPSPFIEIAHIEQDSHSLWVKRDDLIHSIISGNKARKLLRQIESLKQSKPPCLISMGGNHSNFLHALGYVCFKHKIPLTALIRGHQPSRFNRTLQDLVEWKCQLQFVDHQTFRDLRNAPNKTLEKLGLDFSYWIPEGGSDRTALFGLIEAVNELPCEPDHVFIPVGTGCSALGIATGFLQRGWKTKVHGIVVLKGAEKLSESMLNLATSAGYEWPQNLTLNHDFCGNGFGKVTAKIKQEQSRLEQKFNLPLEPVYAVKTWQAVEKFMQSEPRKSKIVVWHTGGLQGNQAELSDKL